MYESRLVVDKHNGCFTSSMFAKLIIDFFLLNNIFPRK